MFRGTCFWLVKEKNRSREFKKIYGKLSEHSRPEPGPYSHFSQISGARENCCQSIGHGMINLGPNRLKDHKATVASIHVVLKNPTTTTNMCHMGSMTIVDGDDLADLCLGCERLWNALSNWVQDKLPPKYKQRTESSDSVSSCLCVRLTNFNITMRYYISATDRHK
eukprot:sb/3472484/